MVRVRGSNTFLSPYSLASRTLHTVMPSPHSFYTSMWVEPMEPMYITGVTPYKTITLIMSLRSRSFLSRIVSIWLSVMKWILKWALDRMYTCCKKFFIFSTAVSCAITSHLFGVIVVVVGIVDKISKYLGPDQCQVHQSNYILLPMLFCNFSNIFLQKWSKLIWNGQCWLFCNFSNIFLQKWSKLIWNGQCWLFCNFSSIFLSKWSQLIQNGQF